MREDDLQTSLSKFPPNFPFAATLVLVQNGFLDVSVDPSFLSNTTRLLVYPPTTFKLFMGKEQNSFIISDILLRRETFMKCYNLHLFMVL